MSSRLHRLIEWPLWSWRHLAITTVVLLAALALVGKATNALSAQATAAPATAPVTPSAPPPTSSMTSSSATVPAPQASRSSTDAGEAGAPCEDVATSFMNAWVRTNLPATEWLRGMRPFASPDLLTQLSRTDPARVPASRVTGSPVGVVTESGAHALRFATDGGRVDASTQKRGSSCVVSDIEPAGDVQGAPTPSLTPSVAAG